MKYRLFQILAWMLISAAALAQTTAPSAPTTRPREVAPIRHGWSHYDALIQRNIFSKGGTSSRDARRDTGVTTPTYRPPSPSNVWVLTGTAITEQEQSAFFENVQTGAAVRLKVGEGVGGGTLALIEREGVTIRYETESRKVAVGMQTDGREASASIPAPVAGAGDATTQPGAAAAPSGATSAEAALLERMRARRAQEK